MAAAGRDVLLSDSARGGMTQCYALLCTRVAWAHARATSTLPEGLPRWTRVALSHHIHIYQRAGRSGSGIMHHAMSKIYFVISRETCGEEHTHTRRHSERERP